MNANIKDIEDGAFGELNTLQELILDSNALTVVTPGMFEGLDSLEELYLTDNELTSIEPGTFGHLSKLTGLYLYSNQLVTLNEDIFEGKLTFFLFKTNHWSKHICFIIFDIMLIYSCNSFNKQ